MGETCYPLKSPMDMVEECIDRYWGQCAPRAIKRGDILAVKRSGGVYYHYAVYLGNDEVIHYASQNGDFNGTICRAPFSDFKKDSREVFALNFSENPKRIPELAPVKSIVAQPRSGSEILNVLIQLRRQANYHLYSPEETVRRAESRLGENQYSLMFNNCEHFAIWCKTGVSESHQVNRVLEILMKYAYAYSY